jgi:regulator of sigma E protease
MPLTFYIGRERPAYEAAPAIIEQIRAGSAAALQGLQPGDRIVTVDGQAVGTWADVQEKMILVGTAPLPMSVRRGGAIKEVLLKANRWGLGFHPASFLANQPVIHEVTRDGPADNAGLIDGDEILAVAGQPIQFWDEFSVAVGSGRSLWFWIWANHVWKGDFQVTRQFLVGGPLTMSVRRDGAVRSVTIVPEYNEKYDRYLIGVRHDAEKAYVTVPKFTKRYGVIDSIVLGEKENWRLLRITGSFLARLVKAPEQHYESLGGPIRIISMFAKIAQEGLSPFLYFLSFFSMQLGILNLLPVPVLDGGHLVFLTIEGIRRRPLTIRTQAVAQQVGLALLLTLFVVITLNDLGHFEWAQSLLKAVGL